ncbi:Reticulocyte-binding protein 2-like protein a [Diplonema papillatum]|nr:Reticulocyte-binding protein 2-like protein a [Diplonema papillatum]
MFEVVVSGGDVGEIAIIAGSCGEGVEVLGGEYRSADSVQSAAFTLNEFGTFEVCVNDGAMILTSAGVVEVAELAFIPKHAFLGERTLMELSREFESGRVAICSRLSCDAGFFVVDPAVLDKETNSVSFVFTSRGGYVCAEWATGVWLNLGVITVSESFSFFPASALMNDVVDIEIDTQGVAEYSFSTLSTQSSCRSSASFVLANPVAMTGEFGSIASTSLVDIPRGQYSVCVEPQAQPEALPRPLSPLPARGAPAFGNPLAPGRLTFSPTLGVSSNPYGAASPPPSPMVRSFPTSPFSVQSLPQHDGPERFGRTRSRSPILSIADGIAGGYPVGRSGQRLAEEDALLRRWAGIMTAERKEVETAEDSWRCELEHAESNGRDAIERELEHELQVVEVNRKKNAAAEAAANKELTLALRQAEVLQAQRENAEKEARKMERIRRETDDERSRKEAERESLRQAKEQKEREESVMTQCRDTELRERREAQQARDEVIASDLRCKERESYRRLDEYSAVRRIVTEELSAREVVANDQTLQFAALSSLHAAAVQQLEKLIGRITHEMTQRKQGEQLQRHELSSFEEDARRKEHAAERMDFEQIVAVFALETVKREQILGLLQQQHRAEDERRREREMQQREHEELSLRVAEDKRNVAQERLRVEEEKFLLEAARTAYRREEEVKRAEDIRRKADDEQKLLEETRLLAERAACARAAEQRARREADNERLRIGTEREALEEAKRRAAEDRLASERAARLAEERRQQREAAVVAEREVAHDMWTQQVSLGQQEAAARRERELSMWSSMNDFLTQFQSSLAEATERSLTREAVERARQRLAEEHNNALCNLSATSYYRTRKERLKDTASELLRTLQVITSLDLEAYTDVS